MKTKKSPSTMKQALKKWEVSSKDKQMDKKYGEGSAKDNRIDRVQASKMIHRSTVKSAAQKMFGGRFSK